MMETRKCPVCGCDESARITLQMGYGMYADFDICIDCGVLRVTDVELDILQKKSKKYRAMEQLLERSEKCVEKN